MPSNEKKIFPTYHCSLPCQYTGKYDGASKWTILLFGHCERGAFFAMKHRERFMWAMERIVRPVPRTKRGGSHLPQTLQVNWDLRFIEQSWKRKIATHSLRSVLATSKERWSRNDRILVSLKEKSIKGWVITSAWFWYRSIFISTRKPSLFIFWKGIRISISALLYR
jgi:hypothetical protein